MALSRKNQEKINSPKLEQPKDYLNKIILIKLPEFLTPEKFAKRFPDKSRRPLT